MSRLRRQAVRAIRDEAGIAVPIALSIMLTLILLGGVATELAIRTNDFSRRSANSKAALEAANAGLRAAIYRLNTYQPSANNCPTQPTTVAVGSSGAPTSTLCPPDGPETLGNGATFTYWVSRAMQTGDPCTGPNVTSGTSTVSQRCVTVVGTANGISVRVQQRLDAYSSTPAFPAALFGTKSVTISNNDQITSDTPGTPAIMGTNGTLCVACGKGGGTTTIDGWSVPPGAVVSKAGNVTDLGTEVTQSAPYPNPTPIYPFTTSTNTSTLYDNATTYQAGTCSQSEASSLYGYSGTWVQTNCDYQISQGISFPACLSLHLAVRDCDPSTKLNNSDFSLANRTLYLPNNATLTLTGGYYNFCSLYLSNNSSIVIAGSGKATIFIDSPSDPTSGCSNSTSSNGVSPGTFTMQNNSTVNAGGSALNAQILVYGDQQNTPPQNAVTLNNNGSTAFALMAPFSNVNIAPSNNTLFRGAIVGYTVTMGPASNFVYEADTSSFQSVAVPVFYPSYWEQCPAKSTSSTDPTAGC